MKKKTIALLLIIALLFTFQLSAVAVQETAAPLKGVAIGDSVTAFVGVTEKEGYVNQLSELLKQAGAANSFTNLGVSGLNSQTLIDQLKKADVLEKIKDADVITLNIGGNNLLGPFVKMILQILADNGITDITKIPQEKLLALASTKLTEAQIKTLDAGNTLLAKDFPVIIQIIKKAAPDAKIYVNTIYDPITKFLGIYEGAEQLITSANKIITETAQAGGCTVIDVYGAFKASTQAMTNFNLVTGSVDIHPNAAGHALIAQKIAPAVIADLEEAGGQERPFNDVPDGSWFEADVAYVFENGLMGGTGNKEFSPYVNTSRGMIVTILWRLEGEPKGAANSFTDVAAGKFYETAVGWATANRIVSGYGNGKFGPEDSITREQFAVILYNYCVFKGTDVTKQADLSGFPDVAKINNYAKTAMQWAVAAGLFKGNDDGTLNPGGNAQRCASAALLHRFCTTVAK